MNRMPKIEAAYVLVPPNTQGGNSPSLDDHGGRTSSTDADLVAEEMLQVLQSRGMRSLIVEDDLARRGDPLREERLVFVGNRVLRWVDLGADGSLAVRLLRTGASGYPLNAFACNQSSTELGLSAGQDIVANIVTIAEATRALIVSVYDGESFLVSIYSEFPEPGSTDGIGAVVRES